MVCNVCGLEYGLSHNCPGPISAGAQKLLEADLKAPEYGGLGYYLEQAFQIVCWDDVAIRRNAKDTRATPFAVMIWAFSMLVVLLVTTYPALARALDKTNPVAVLIGLSFGISAGLAIMAVITFAQLSLCHLLAKWLFGATGKFGEIMRPLLLGWIVNCLTIVPVAGLLLAAIGWTAVLMMVFEEVDGIERLQAFGISAGINICFFILQFSMMPVRHHL